MKQCIIIFLTHNSFVSLRGETCTDMHTKDEYLHQLRRFKQEHSSEYGIESIGIFGSVARGEQTESSDIDICIEAPPMGLFMFSGLCIKLEKLLDMPVDIVRMRKNMNPRFRERIEKEMIYV